jgi:cytochrome c oxidase assembly factor CtaG
MIWQSIVGPNYRRLLQRKELNMDFLLYWTTWEQIIFVLVVFSVVSVFGLYLVRILVPLERLKQNHEVAGFTFGVIGAFYGLLLAFVIVAAWERFDRADAEVQTEGVALTSLYRLAKGFTEPVAAEMQKAIRTYTTSSSTLTGRIWRTTDL